MTKEQLLSALKPHFPVISGLIRAAVDEFESFAIPIDRRPVIDGAPSGILVYHLIWDHLERHFGRAGPIRVAETDGLKVLFFETSGLSIRVNKLDSLTLASGLSQDAGKLHNHPQLFFSFHDEPTGHLIFGYTKRPDERGVMVLDRIFLTLENEDGVLWSTYIDDEATTAMLTAPPPTPPVVRPKALPSEMGRVKGESAAG